MKSIQKSIFSVAILSLLVIFTGCKKDKKVDPTQNNDEKGSLEVHLENKAGATKFYLNESYVTANGDSVMFTKFDYYLSNFEFIKTDGSVYTVPKDKSYFLVKADDMMSQMLEFEDVSAGDYKGVRFIIGIDSAKSASPATERTGILDVSTSGMYWSWNSGYIFVKAEGTCPQIADSSKVFKYHIGGFGGYDSPTINNIKKVEIMFHENDVARVTKDIKPTIHFFVNPLEMFTNPHTISVRDSNIVTFKPFSTKIADNYADMFQFDHIH